MSLITILINSVLGSIFVLSLNSGIIFIVHLLLIFIVIAFFIGFYLFELVVLLIQLNIFLILYDVYANYIEPVELLMGVAVILVVSCLVYFLDTNNEFIHKRPPTTRNITKDAIGKPKPPIVNIPTKSSKKEINPNNQPKNKS